MTDSSRIFLGWEQPLPQLAVRRLFARIAPGSLPDFSDCRIVVPTAEAGRLLKEAMAEYFPEGIIGLEILMPEMLLQPEDETPAATAEVLAAWSRTLEKVPANTMEPLLGKDFAETARSPELRIAAGALLQNCRKSLALDSCSVRKAAETFRRTGMQEQTERFFLLKKLEDQFLQLCPQDPVSLIAHAVPPEQDERMIIVLHCPDLRGAAAGYLRQWPGRVEYWIHAPQELADLFDSQGRAHTDWNKRPFPLDPATQLNITIHAEEQVDILETIRQNPDFQARAVGVLDPDLAGAWQDRLRQAQSLEDAVFFPAMRPLGTLPWTRLYTALLSLRQDPPDRDVVAAVLRHGFLADKTILAELDRLQEETIAQNLTSLLAASRPGKLQTALKKLQSWHYKLARHPREILSECWAILREIGEDPHCPAFDRRSGALELAALESLITAAEHAAGNVPELACAVFLQLCSTAQARPLATGEENLDAVGFLELPWYGDSTVIVAGFSENVMAGNRLSDPFLPEQARKLLDLQTAEQSSAADAFRFAAMQNTAHMRFLVCRYGMRQDALKPPAIFMRCPEQDLPRRIGELFGDGYVLPAKPAGKGPSLPPLIPRRVEREKKRLSVTDFAQYMRCPFTFYLQKILKAETAGGKAIELDNAQSGTLLHDVIAGCENAMKTGADAETLFQNAQTGLKVLKHRFGEPPPGLLDLQFSVMEDNLRYFADAQAQWYQQNWRLIRSEKEDQKNALQLTAIDCTWAEFFHKVFPAGPREAWRDEITFKGRFDRLDARENADGTRELCVIDYKTGAAQTPEKKHFCTGNGLTEEERSYRQIPNKDQFWADLQLPLYVLMIRHLLPEEKADGIRAAYFNLPVALTDTGVYEFDGLDEELLHSAMTCADRIARRIYGPDPVFWPPRKYETLFEACEQLSAEDFDAGSFYLAPEEEA